MGTGRITMSRKVQATRKPDCIEHAGYRMPNGYGQVRRYGKTWLAHRWAAYQALGPAPAGKPNVLHSCDNRACINPEHLRYGTQSENLLDRTRRHRYRKLTAQDVARIKVALAEGVPGTALAREFGVSGTMISNIKHGKQWNENQSA